MDAILEQKQSELGFHGGHVALVAFVAVALAGFTFIKNPELFRLRSNSATATEAQKNQAPKYYAYEAPPLPAVLGETTEPTGPSIINEDGTISSLSDMSLGEVLGVSTQDVVDQTSSLKIATVPTTRESVDKYYHYIVQQEGYHLGNSELETALSGNDPVQINIASTKIGQLIVKLEHMYAPTDAVKFHKLKVARYYAAQRLLENYSHLDQNPEMVTQQLGVFFQAMQEENQELERLITNYHLNDNVAP
jgi:hypothetical protein